MLGVLRRFTRDVRVSCVQCYYQAWRCFVKKFILIKINFPNFSVKYFAKSLFVIEILLTFALAFQEHTC